MQHSKDLSVISLFQTTTHSKTGDFKFYKILDILRKCKCQLNNLANKLAPNFKKILFCCWHGHFCIYSCLAIHLRLFILCLKCSLNKFFYLHDICWLIHLNNNNGMQQKQMLRNTHLSWRFERVLNN